MKIIFESRIIYLATGMCYTDIYRIYHKGNKLAWSMFLFLFNLHDVHFKTSEPFKILCHPDFATVDFFSTIAKTKT